MPAPYSPILTISAIESMELAIFLALLCLTSATASASRGPRTTTSSSTSTGGAIARPFCTEKCCCDDDDSLRQTFEAELRSHVNNDDRCRALLKAYICEACMNTTAAVSFPLDCVYAAPSLSTVRHDDDLGSSAVCLQKASTTVFDGLVAVKDGSDKVVCWGDNGLMWLGTVDVSHPNDIALRVDEQPFANLSTRGIAGVAVDSTRQQLFVSYYTNEDAEGAGAGAGGSPSSSLVIDQVQWQASASSEGRQEATLRRLFSMPCQSGSVNNHYGGHIEFRRNNADPLLYVETGPVESNGQLQSQILRFPVEQDTPSGGTELYASLSGVPRGFVFDADKPQDAYCAMSEVDQELVYLISDPYAPSSPPPSPTIVVGQQRSTTSPSIIGGLLYRGNADKTLTGSYIYVQGSTFWVSPVPGYSTAREMRVTCSASNTSPQSCVGGSFTATVSSFGQDANNNALLLTTQGVYIVVEPSQCDAEADPEAAPAWKNIVMAWIKKIFSNTWIKIIAGIIGIVAAGVGGYQISVHCCDKNNEGNDGHVEMDNIAGNVHIENHYY